MRFKSKFKILFSSLSGYWFYKARHLPVGTDLFVDLQKKIKLNLDVIFDVGANRGQSALKFSSFFPCASIFSFEPISRTYNELVEKTKTKKNIQCYKLALGDKNENIQVRLFDENASVLNSLREDAMNTDENATIENVSVETLDFFLEKHKIKNISLLKIDTEGYEINVLKGATQALAEGKIQMIYAEVGFTRNNQRNTYFLDLNSFLEQYGFTFYGLYDISHIKLDRRKHYGNALFLNNSLLTNLKRWQK